MLEQSHLFLKAINNRALAFFRRKLSSPSLFLSNINCVQNRKSVKVPPRSCFSGYDIPRLHHLSELSHFLSY